LLGLLFKPEDTDDMFLRNVDWLSTTAWCYIPEDRTLHNHRCENIKSYTACVCLFHSSNRRYRVNMWYFVLFKINNQSTIKLISYLMCPYTKLI
jgi:hypothetical protein